MNVLNFKNEKRKIITKNNLLSNSLDKDHFFEDLNDLLVYFSSSNKTEQTLYDQLLDYVQLKEIKSFFFELKLSHNQNKASKAQIATLTKIDSIVLEINWETVRKEYLNLFKEFSTKKEAVVIEFMINIFNDYQTLQKVEILKAISVNTSFVYLINQIAYDDSFLAVFNINKNIIKIYEKQKLIHNLVIKIFTSHQNLNESFCAHWKLFIDKVVLIANDAKNKEWVISKDLDRYLLMVHNSFNHRIGFSTLTVFQLKLLESFRMKHHNEIFSNFQNPKAS